MNMRAFIFRQKAGYCIQGLEIDHFSVEETIDEAINEFISTMKEMIDEAMDTFGHIDHILLAVEPCLWADFYSEPYTEYVTRAIPCEEGVEFPFTEINFMVPVRGLSEFVEIH